MTDVELDPARRARLDEHLARCAACRAEAERGTALDAAFAAWDARTAEPPAVLAANALRRMRLAAADDAERPGGRWAWSRWIGVAMAPLAAAAVLVLAVRLAGTPVAPPAAPAPAAHDVAAARAARPAAPVAAAARAPATAPSGDATRVARGAPSAERRVASRPPDAGDPPPDLMARPDLFIRLPMLRQLDKLQHWDAIQTTAGDDTGDGARSNG